MPRLIRLKAGEFRLDEDRFTLVADDLPLPEGDVIVSFTRFLAEGDSLFAQGREVGVRIAADQSVDDLAYDAPRIAVAALEFPKFRDGRAYTAARLLRERYGFVGEIRAVGDVLREQASFMVRCGFDAFEPADGSTPEQWATAAGRFRHVYQRAADDRAPAFAEREALSREAAMPYEGGEPLELADVLDGRLREADPSSILSAAIAQLGERLALVSSFGAESAVLLHLAAAIKPDIPILFLDTGMLFGQTLDYRQQLAARLGLTDVRDLRPQFQDLAVHDAGADLWRTDTDACCNIRKVLPLDRALGEFDGWITGRKRFQGGDRLRLRVVEQDGARLKFNPLANWSKDQLDAYAAKHDLPAHPLVAHGYPSIGCWPCTQPVEEGQDARAGRWAGSQKTECGIHMPHAVSTLEVGGDI